MIWAYAPKQGFASKEVVELSAHLATARFNHGAVSLLAVLEEMGCMPGYFAEQQLEGEDAEKVIKAEKKVQGEHKKRRKALRRRRKGLEDVTLEAEGLFYEPGAFD